MKFSELEVDDQFTLPLEVCIAPGTLMQKQGDTWAIIVNELIFNPDTEVEKVE